MIFIVYFYFFYIAGKPRQNESDLSKPLSAGIRKPNLGLPAHTVSGQKRKDLSPVNPGMYFIIWIFYSMILVFKIFKS